MRYRIQFKINLLTYKVYKTDYPVYLKDCVQPYSSAYNTRRSEPAQHMLNVPYYDYKGRPIRQPGEGYGYFQKKKNLTQIFSKKKNFPRYVQKKSLPEYQYKKKIYPGLSKKM